MRVLVLATSPQMRGGIPAVLNLHRKTNYWKEFNCCWLATHIDKSKLHKLLYFFKGLIVFICIAPFYDIIHIHLSEPPSAIRKLFFFLIGTLYQKKTIIHFHSFSPETTIEGRFKTIYQYMFSRSTMLIVLSAQWKQWVETSIDMDSDKILVVFNPCQDVEASILPKTKSILFAGTLSKRKGYHDLIVAFAALAARKKDWKLIFAGNGEIELAKKIAKKNNVEKQVEFLGWVSGKEKHNSFSQSSIFCLPSYAEGFPMAVLDAFSYGLPVVTTGVGGIPDVMTDGSEGLIFSPGDTTALSAKLLSLMESEGMRSFFSEKSRVLASTVFSPDTISNQITNIYNQI